MKVELKAGKKTVKKYTIFDWENEKFIEVNKKRWKKYQKLKAELHEVMFPKKTA